MRVLRSSLPLAVLVSALAAANATAQIPPSLLLTEVVASNASILADEDGDFSDWVEIANVGPVPISLNGYGLTDNPSRPFKWAFGNVTIQPSQYLVVFASSKDRPLHTSWAISAGGETIVLTAPDGTTIDSVATGSMRVDISRGRREGAGIDWPYFDQPTPGAPNTTPWYLGFAEAPTLSQPSGKYAAPFDVTVSAADAADHVTFTLDGRPPMPSDPVATGAWPITQTRILRARAFRDGYIPSPPVTGAYFMNEPTALPIVSLVTDPDSLFHPDTGLFSLGPNPGDPPFYPTANFRSEAELPIHVALFEPDGTTGFELNAGMELQGGVSRVFQKKSIRIEAKAAYGTASIDYRVFPDKPVDSFTHLLLRSSSEDQYETLFRDALSATLADVTTLDRQAYRPVVLYINGQYWGIHNLREVATEEYIQDTYGYDEDEIDVIENNGTYEVRAGTPHNFLQFVDFVLKNDLAVPANYDALKTMLDIENVLDYFAFEIFVGNTDWPGNNIRYWRPRAAGGKWRILLFDLDNGLRPENVYHDTLTYATNAVPQAVQYSHNQPEDTFLLVALLRNPEFVTEFIRRLDDMNNIVFSPARVGTAIQRLAAGIAGEMPREIERWWAISGYPLSMDSWLGEISGMWAFAYWRPWVMQHFVDQHFNLQRRSYLTLDVRGSGAVRVNSQQPPGYPYSGSHASQVPVRLTALPQPGFRFARWSGAVDSSEPELLLDMAANRKVIAHFVPDESAE
jgi:hypothetical protein